MWLVRRGCCKGWEKGSCNFFFSPTPPVPTHPHHPPNIAKRAPAQPEVAELLTVMSSRATALATALCRGDRLALSRALTLVESRHPRNRADATALLSSVLLTRRQQQQQHLAATAAADAAANATATGAAAASSLRIGISGPPGTGKSTLIESLGGELLSRGHRLAVLAVDPSSQRSGGSIMGDKTRMSTLSADRRAFIRPSPSQGVLGGVARRTSDAVLCCEAAGYDRLIVETVGVGQSEIAVAGLVDMFVLLVPPAAGDGLQGVKRGIMELADLVVVTKADGKLEAVAGVMAQDVRSALRVLRPRSRAWTPRVIRTSVVKEAPKGRGPMAQLADVIDEFRVAMEPTGELSARRREQAGRAVWEHASVELLERLAATPEVERMLVALGERTAAGELSVGQAGAAAAEWLSSGVGEREWRGG